MTSILTTIQTKLSGAVDSSSGKKALLLGAGFVTKPTVEILAKDGIEVTVGEFPAFKASTSDYSSLSNTRIGQKAL